MAPMIEPIAIVGLREVIRALKQIDSDYPKAIRIAANKAADIVVREAQRNVPSRTGSARASVKAKSTRTAARISSGGRKAPYFPWLDYGGRVGRNKSVKRPFIADGRYVYPAYSAKREEFIDGMYRELADICRSAGLDLS